MLSGLTIVATAIMPAMLSASLFSFATPLQDLKIEHKQGSVESQSVLNLPAQHLRTLNGRYERQYIEDGELVTEVVYVEQLDNGMALTKTGNRQIHNVPTSCKVSYPDNVAWFRHGWCYGRFHSEVQANPGKLVFAHVGVIDDNGRHTKTPGGWSSRGGQITRTLAKPKTCKKKCTVLTTYRTK